MSFLDIFKKRDREVDANTVDDVLLKAIINGEAIKREDALTLPAVSGAVDFISGTIASMPVKLYKYKQGKVEEQDKDPRVTMLNTDTGDTLNAYQLKKALVEDYLLGKGGYCYIERERNEVVALKYIPEEFISIYRDPNPLDKWFTIFCYDTEFYPHDFIKLLRNTKDGASGVGLCAEVSKALETAYNMLKYQLMLVKSGGNKKGFIKSTRKLGQEEIDLLKAAWQNLYANDQSNVVVLNNGLEFQEASNTSVEMQLNESKKTLQDEINNIFHISGDYYETFKTAIYPIVKAFETELNRVLLLEKEKGKYFFEFDVKEIIRANIKERYEAYKIAKEIGLKTLNELRRDENLNDIEGLDVVDFGLGSVLYDVNTKQYYTPNTGDVKGGDVTVSEDGDENISYSEHIPLNTNERGLSV
ncbi:MAG: phage portal protein [Clostridia bacterium]|nr:phage portal protein [Clostridia bacterium]